MSAPRGSKAFSEAGVREEYAKVASMRGSAHDGENRISGNSLALLEAILENASWLAV